MSWAEKRHSPRKPVQIEVDCESGVQRWRVPSYDLSATGLSLLMAEPLAVGSTLRLSFRLPRSGDLVVVQGAVVWCSPEPCRVGIHFQRFEQGYIELGDYLLGSGSQLFGER